MKKYLLSLVCLLCAGLGLPASAATITEIITVDNFKTGSTGWSGYLTKEYVSETSGLVYNIHAASATSPVGLQMNVKKGAYIEISENRKDVVISEVRVTLASAGNNANYEVYASDNICYEIPATVATTVNVTASGDLVASMTANQEYAVAINNKFFGIFPKTSVTTKGAAIVTKIEVDYVSNDGPVAPAFSGVPKDGDFEMIVGDTRPLPEIEPKKLVYTFSTGDASVIAVDNDTKTVKAVGIGTATVNFTTEAIDGEYLAGSGSFKVTVSGKDPGLSFANSSVYGKAGTGVVWQTVNVAAAGATGAIRYTSSDPEVVAVDETTGRILPADVKKAGNARITATIAASGEYAEASANYLIVVVDADERSANTLFDFTGVNAYGMTTQSGSSGKYETEITSITGEHSLVTLDFGGNYRSWNTGNACQLRLQKSASMTISVPEGYRITKIGITGTINTGYSYTPASGTVTGDDKEFSNVWVPAGDTPVSSVVFKAGSSNRQEITRINVMWDAVDSGLEPAQLTFTPNVNGIYVDEVGEINAVNNPFGRPVKYTIPALDESEYEIEEVDGMLHVLVLRPGSYTLEARSDAGEGTDGTKYRDGLAIMRLNVYRHLDVYVDGTAITQDVIETGSGCSVTFNVPENAYLYYRIVDATATAAEDGDVDENQETGFSRYGGVIDIDAKTNGYLEFYIANYGYKSPKRRVSLTFETGVEEIAVSDDAPVRYFDLSGREVKGNPEKGIYIRLQGNKATKIMVK